MTKANETLKKILQHQQRICLLATSGPEGCPNSAIFGAVKVHDGSVQIAMGDNLSFSNLRQNPAAQLTAFIPGTSPQLYRGIRLNLNFEKSLTEGDLFDALLTEVRANAGNRAAAMIHRIVVFSIDSQLPLVNLDKL